MNVECLHLIFSLEVSSNLDETKNAPKGFVFSYGAFLSSKKRWILEYSEVFRGYESR